MEPLKKIVLVDDHVIIRNGLKELIEKIGPYQVIMQFDNGQSFLRHRFGEDHPDLIIMDVSMPRMNGDEVMERLKAKKNKIPIMILTLNEDENMIIKLFRLGARAYLRKNCTAAQLKEALNDIFQSGLYRNEYLASSMESDGLLKKTEQEKILEQLSDREKHFLALVCNENELTYEEIAEKMNLSVRTIDGYRDAIFAKFAVKSKAGLVLYILKHKLYEILKDGKYTTGH